MRGKEILHIVASVRRAETSRGAYQHGSHLGGELGLDLVPIRLNVLPRQVADFIYLECNRKLHSRILIADLSTDGVVQGALSESGILELGEQTKSVCLYFG